MKPSPRWRKSTNLLSVPIRRNAFMWESRKPGVTITNRKDVWAIDPETDELIYVPTGREFQRRYRGANAAVGPEPKPNLRH